MVVVQHAATGVANGLHHHGREMRAAVAEDGVGSGHFQRAGVVGAEGDRGSGAHAGDACGLGERGYVAESDALRHAHGRVVQRQRESVTGGDCAVKCLVVVARLVDLCRRRRC